MYFHTTSIVQLQVKSNLGNTQEDLVKSIPWSVEELRIIQAYNLPMMKNGELTIKVVSEQVSSEYLLGNHRKSPTS